MARLELKNVAKTFNETEVIKSVNLSVADGEFAVLVGPSGCGKSTILRMLAGLEQVSGGAIEIDGRNVTSMLPLERGVAMVFQSYALYPHMTVEDNIGFGLKIAGQSRAERRPKVLEAARILQLEPYLARKPKQLSGGQRQRVAIGRAIVKQPKIFLFDEPLSNLDAELRVQMRLEIARLHQQLGATMIYVTHDQVEAMTLADKIVVLRDGRIEQAGPPVELYERPANIFVAGFIGSPKMNFLDAVPADGKLSLPGLGGAIAGSSASVRTLGVRPEHISITDAGAFAGTVKVVEQLGNVSYLYVDSAAGATVTIEQRRMTGLHAGDAVRFDIEHDQIHLFDGDGRRL
ncbi:sn-glycerol-3-phosphate ABC transporter ATP-binding protein UgpC [Mesorhizobium sp. BR1-1-16]|uniref:ABC transporter ATP-binding protein n=1 Tax=Mesorhizobium sp. BR1-1-16 TaxID=2876653 RepID=UPI001CCE8D33|nr:sn-glycerol-3-phosphate ABC transporter ATP-binding protein UgpC [Mesorhizobium sp. BR1-1-16]MBZ9938564.1 sn-glycerol-3-phosphate ABC transporter ATP-binding protein UgpC [Mesorhizobium sp. BR1-1-16]